jgi:SAM-dependent methyltransferase
MSNPAESYESYMVPVLFGPWARRLVGLASPRPGEHVLDLACGTGAVARQAAPLVGSIGTVTGVDLSPHMLEVARAASRREGVAVEWRAARAEDLPFPDGTFDLVLCQFALMFFEDRTTALREVRRVLKPKGRLLLSVWQGLARHPFYETLDSAIQRRLGTAALQAIFALGDETELRRLLVAAGFAHVTLEPLGMTARFPNPAGFLAGEIDVDTAALPSMQGLDDEARRAMVEAIAEDMKGPLREVTRDDHVVLEFHATIAHASEVA